MSTQKSGLNVTLKIAILTSGQRQRGVAGSVGIPETRLSEIVNQRGTAPTDDEKQALATFLGRDIAELFPEPEALAS